MTTLEDLLAMETEEAELIPEILPVDARLSIKGPVSSLISLFERAASVTPAKEIVAGTGYALVESFLPTTSEVAYVRITATDARQTITITGDGINVARAGAVLLPGKRMLEILKLAPSDTARIDVLGTTATVLSGRAQWTVQTPTGSALPPLPNADDINVHAVPREAFLTALTVARKAVATSGGRPALAQELIENGSVTASDGGRIHRMVIPGFPKSLRMSIPRESVDELMKALRASDAEHIRIGASDYLMVFRLDDYQMLVQRLLVEFPNVESLILGPAFSNLNALTVDRADLADTVSRVRVNSDPEYAAIFLSLVPGKKADDGQLTWSLAVRSKDRHGNAAQEIIECQWTGSSKATELCVNHKYLSDLLTSYDNEIVIFKIGDDTKTQKLPLFIEDSEVGFTGVIQQMRAGML